MKKLLIMLMVVTMASFLFVGCLPVTPPIDPVDPDPVLPVSITPVIEKITNVDDESIINLYSSATQYMNKAEVKNGILVKGFALKYSEVKVYVRGVVVGTSTTYGVLERFTVFVAKASLGDDGAKTLYATATEMGLAESAPSTVYAFTLDVVAPDIEKVAVDLEEETVTVTFDEAVNEDTAEENESYIVYNITEHWEIYTLEAELISSKVVELEVDPRYWFGEEGNTIRVTCEVIEDLAGNEATDLFEYCYAEGGDPWPYKHAEITVVGISTFYVDTPGIVIFEIEANDDEGKNVLTYFTVPVGLTSLSYWSEDWDQGAGDWVPLPFDEPFGPSGGYPLIDAEVTLQAKFGATGTFKTTVEIWKIDEDGEKDYRLCSKVITAVVIAP
ncbi:hypothetical protein ES708_28690 [subsurface metagenome]